MSNIKNSIYIEDADLSISPSTETYISPEMLTKSKMLQGAIQNNLIKVVSASEDIPIERAALHAPKKEIALHENMDTVISDKVEDKISVEIKGIFYEASGYGKVNRYFAKELSNSGINVSIKPLKGQNQLSESELKDIVKFESVPLPKNHIKIDSIIPSFSETSSGKYRILYTTIEAHSIPDSFAECCKSYNEIWTTSDFAKNILSTKTDKEIFIIPTGVDPEIFNENVTPIEFNPPLKDFVFISVFGWNYRKGYDLLLKSYCDAFKSSDNVSLLILSRYMQRPSSKQKILDDISKITKNYSDVPHYAVSSNIFSEQTLAQIYRSCNAFVLSSRGESTCCLPDTQIITQRGVLPIKDITCDDFVITHNKRWKKVSETMHRNINGTICCIQVTGHPDSLKVTSDHLVFVLRKSKCFKRDCKNKKEFLLSNCEWIAADEIQKGDYLVHPRIDTNASCNKTLDVQNYVSNFIKDNDLLYRKARNQHGAEFKHPRCQPIKSVLELSDDFLFFIGLYISEGWSGSKLKRRRGLSFAFNKSEKNLHEHIEKMIQAFNSKVCYHSDCFNNENQSFNLSTNNTLLSELMGNLCGIGAYNKKLPTFSWNLDDQQAMKLLQGVFDGDGSCEKIKDKRNGRINNRLALSTVSHQLANEVYSLLRCKGFSPIIQRKKGRGFIVGLKGEQLDEIQFKRCFRSSKETKERTVSTSDAIFSPVRQVTNIDYVGPVYNLEVEDDKSYTTVQGVIHNCIPPCEASLCGLPVIMTNCSGQTMWLTKENSYLFDIDNLEQVQTGWSNVNYWDGELFPALKSQKCVDDLSSLMQEVHNNYKKAKSKNKKLQKLLRKQFLWKHAAEKATERLKVIWEKHLRT